jgi:TolA-binding protein
MSMLTEKSTRIRDKARKGLEILCNAEQEQSRKDLEAERDAQIETAEAEIAQMKDQIATLERDIQSQEKNVQDLKEVYKQKIVKTLKTIEKSYSM